MEASATDFLESEDQKEDRSVLSVEVNTSVFSVRRCSLCPLCFFLLG